MSVKQQRDLEDAEAVLARYNRMCFRLTFVFIASVLGLGGCALLLHLGAGAEMWLVGLPCAAAAVASLASFINVVNAANENKKTHPADKVRQAQRALDDAHDETVLAYLAPRRTRHETS